MPTATYIPRSLLNDNGGIFSLRRPAEGLPTGWTRILVRRKNGGKDDPFYFSPMQSFKFNSLFQVKRFLVCLEEAGGDEAAAYVNFRGAEAKIKASEKKRKLTTGTADDDESIKNTKKQRALIDKTSNDVLGHDFATTTAAASIDVSSSQLFALGSTWKPDCIKALESQIGSNIDKYNDYVRLLATDNTAVADDNAAAAPPAVATIEDVGTAESEKEVEEPVSNALYDDTFLTSSTLPSWSYNYMPLHRWTDGRSYHDQLSSTCSPINNHPKLLLRRKQSKQIFQVWLDDRKRDWSTKQESRVEHEPRKLMHNIKEINLYGISKLAMKKPRSYKFHKGKRKGDQTKRKAKGDAVQATYDLTVDAIDEIEIFCYSLILVEHWQNSFHLTCEAIIALESFALESMQAIFDCTLQQPFVPPLPTGWTRILVRRKNGNYIGKDDPYYFSPMQSYKFRSLFQVKRFLVCLEEAGGDEVAAYVNFRGAEAKIKASEKKRKLTTGTADDDESIKNTKKQRALINKTSNDALGHDFATTTAAASAMIDLYFIDKYNDYVRLLATDNTAVADDNAAVAPPALATIEDVRTAESEKEVEEQVSNAIDNDTLEDREEKEVDEDSATTWMEGCLKPMTPIMIFDDLDANEHDTNLIDANVMDNDTSKEDCPLTGVRSGRLRKIPAGFSKEY